MLTGLNGNDQVLRCILQMYFNAHWTSAGQCRISRNIDSAFNLAVWQMHQDRQINLRHYQSIYTTSMGSLHTVLKFANLKSC